MIRVAHGDCRDVMRQIPDAFFDSIVTDPPYGLAFMGKGWDHSVPGPDYWIEALRVAKPGAHMLAFGGTRTYHRLACAIEDAGWEIRDTLSWLYGSGFPKSLDVSKAIDKAGGVSPADQARILAAKREAAGLTREALAALVGCTPSSVRDWEEGRARVAGGPLEHMVPSESYRARLCEILGYTEDERRVIGLAAARAGDGSAIGLGHSGTIRDGGHSGLARQWAGWGTALKPAWEPIILARKPLIGTVAENVSAHGTGGLNVNGCRIENPGGSLCRDPSEPSASRGYEARGASGLGGVKPSPRGGSSAGRWPANVCLDEAAAEALDAQTGTLTSGKVTKTYTPEPQTSVALGAMRRNLDPSKVYSDSGGASRFFYCAKASKAERGAGNNHPTVKPIALMRWCVRLVTPPGGLVLDPFGGSGSTGIAADAEGMRALLIEREAEYVEIIRRRAGLTA